MPCIIAEKGLRPWALGSRLGPGLQGLGFGL
jgi:hypothetical protein